MTRQSSINVLSPAEILTVPMGAYVWANQYGGLWNTALNWTNAGTVAASAPTGANIASITGGSNNNFTTIAGSGAAAQLLISRDVLLWGSVAVSGTATIGGAAFFDLDGASNLTAGGLNLHEGASLLAGGSTLAVGGTAALAAASITALNGSTLQLGALIADTINTGLALETGTIAVDDTSAIELGTAGGAALGAITIDAGQTAVVSGTLYGNVVAAGTLAIQAGGTLSIDAGDPFGTAQSISGTGTLLLSENSLLTFGVSDSAAIAFGGPMGTLDLKALPTATISGFAAGDIIELHGGATVMATGLSYTQTSSNIATLTLTKGGQAVGALTLAGNYAGSLFHLGLDAQNNGIISLRTIGTAPVQPNLIIGTAGRDTLFATANNQTLTGLGGNDSLAAAAFTGISFKDTSAALNGSTIESFGTTGLIDLTDINSSSASVSYTLGTQTATVIITDGTRTATIGLTFDSALPPGFFGLATDGSGGTIVRYNAANTDNYMFAASPGGAFGTASSWQNTTAGATATLPPGYGNTVTIAGGSSFTNVTGNGIAASATTSGDVLLFGSVVVGTKLTGVSGALVQTGTLALDGAANLSLAGIATVGGLIEIGRGSSLTAAGGLSFSTNAAQLVATGGSSAQFTTILSGSGSAGTPVYASSAIGVDPTSSIELGNAGSVMTGALTIDTGVTANLAGSINGNVVVNGTLAAAGTLAIASFGSSAPTISGGGTIELTFGDTVSLAGPDSVPILFNQIAAGNNATMTETLVLSATMPTGVISGFTKGDVIVVGLLVTNLSWNGAKLTLLNGGTTVGSLSLSGVYAANQFQVQLAPDGISSVITYAATPSTAGGNSVSGTSDSYVWNNVSGGVWSNSGNWIDSTAGGTPSSAPGASNPVTISNTTGTTTSQIIYGPGAAASLTITSAANTVLNGSVTVSGQFAVNSDGIATGGVVLDHGTNLSAGSLNVTSQLRLAGASLLTVLGISGGSFVSGGLTVGSGSAVRISGGTSVVTGTVAVDTSSSVEIGNAGTATTGKLTIDGGQTLTLQGVANIAANVVNNGTLMVYSGTIQGFGGAVGAITGTGSISLGALGPTGYLVLNATDTLPINFVGYSLNGAGYAFETLELRKPLQVGTLFGFVAGDTIVIDKNVTGISFTQTTNNQGTLTLSNGGVTVGTLTFSGNYAANMFQLDMAPGTGIATVSLQSTAAAGSGASVNTGNHAYSWTGNSGGSWTTAANWRDTTSGTTPTTVPGTGNAVTIAGGLGATQYTTIGGNGATSDLSITGNVLLTGQVNVAGSVHVSSGSGPAAALTLAAGASLIAGGSVEVFGRLEFVSGSSATVTGYALLFGGSMLALNGSVVQTGGLIGDGAGDVIAVDTNSAVKIGTATNAAAGAVTIGAGAPAQFNGQIYASVAVNGTFSVGGGGTMLIDMTPTASNDPFGSNRTITGTGTFALTEGSTLGLGVASSAAVQFVGPNATLLLGAIPTSTITGFVAGDRIQLNQTVTNLTYAQVSGTAATLTLFNGTNSVGVLKLAGSFNGGGTAFHLDGASDGHAAVITLQSLQIAPIQPTLIYGTVGSDSLVATANGQTLSGYGGGDMLSGGAFTGVRFKDYSFYLSGSAIQNFAPSDIVDFIDIKTNTATVNYTGGLLTVSDGTRSASLSLAFANGQPGGSFHIASDGGAGTKLTWS